MAICYLILSVNQSTGSPSESRMESDTMITHQPVWLLQFVLDLSEDLRLEGELHNDRADLGRKSTCNDNRDY